jgi:SAM-dependent methyltransferase
VTAPSGGPTTSSRIKRLWDTHALPFLVEKACRSGSILEERRRWVPRATGDVLEIGIGSGLNLGLYDAERVTSLVGADPSVPLLDKARLRARDAAFPVELAATAGERLPFDAARFDTAVVTYTLCSVASPSVVLGEIRRVLRPGGKLVLIEHGASPEPGPLRWQRRITPLWRQVAGNCHLDRDVAFELAAAGYVFDEVEAAHAPEGSRLTSFTTAGIAAPRP